MYGHAQPATRLRSRPQRRLNVGDENEAIPTILTDRHRTLGARMAPFGGFQMPIQYDGIVSEHNAVRRGVGLFDTCHMGEFIIQGSSATSDLDHLLTCNVATLDAGQCRYGLICNPDGGVIDDMIIYRTGEVSYMMVVNAGTQAGDFAWIREQVSDRTELRDVSQETGKIDLQGPDAPAMLANLLDDPIAGLKYFRFLENRLDEATVRVSRTGYTGEIGFELYASNATTLILWDRLLEAGATPAGLGARDTLRLEVGLPLYGHEMGTNRNAGESGFTSILSPDKNFVGCEAVRRHMDGGSVLTGVVLDGRRAAREGDVIQLVDGETVGEVTSGSFSPSLGRAIALGYVRREHVQPGQKVKVVTARQDLPGTLESTPLYKEGTARKSLKQFLEASS